MAMLLVCFLIVLPIVWFFAAMTKDRRQSVPFEMAAYHSYDYDND